VVDGRLANVAGLADRIVRAEGVQGAPRYSSEPFLGRRTPQLDGKSWLNLSTGIPTVQLQVRGRPSDRAIPGRYPDSISLSESPGPLIDCDAES